VKRVLADEPHKDEELRAEWEHEKAVLRFLAWLSRNGDAWVDGDYRLYLETVNSSVLLMDGIEVHVRV